MMMEDEAKRAIMELNGCMLNGNRLNVEVRYGTRPVCFFVLFVSSYEDQAV